MKKNISILCMLFLSVFFSNVNAQFTNNQPAAGVIGQATLTGYGAGLTDSKLTGPNGVAIDQATGKLFIADRGNHRILRWSSADAYVNGSAAEAVFGQTGFTTNTSGAAVNKFNNPIGVFVDKSGSLWVGDFSNNRVLRFDNASTKATGANADGVLGQPDFTTAAAGVSATALTGPVGVYVDDSGTLWVTDYNNNRIVKYKNAASKANGAAADGVLGQNDFSTNTSGLSANKFTYPNSVYIDVAGNLWVSDFSNKRVLRFDNAAAKPNGANADGVLGQPNFTTNASSISRNGAGSTRFVYGDAKGRLYVIQEDSYRIMVYDNAAAKPNGADADGVLGQADFVSKALLNPPTASSFNVPRAMTINNKNGHIWVADYSNNRVLRFELTETISKSLKVTAPDGGEEWPVGTTQKISWTSSSVDKVKLEYSTNSGTSWLFIDSANAAAGYYTWTVPNTGSAKALVRITDNSDKTLSDTSNNTFVISDKVFVIIGSSTAAGNGASPIDSAWVWRYTSYLKTLDPKAMLVNLAIGGYTTYDVMPSDYVPAAGLPTPKTSNNITYALTFKPNAIIVNLPSNDANAGYPISDQMKNYAVMANLAAKANAKMWICTTQPRYLTETAKKNILTGTRDSILAVYKSQAINVWDGLAASDGTILTAYSYGDGVHLNNAGHRVMFEKIAAAKIYEALVVPVELTAFSLKQSGTKIQLNWSTATETNNRGFEIQKRVIANNSTSDFKTISFVKGCGTTANVQQYTYTDDIANLNAQQIIYRLKQIDYDGTFAYSQQLYVNSASPIQFELEQNYPNPFNPNTTIQYSIPFSSKVELKIYDALGREVKTLVSEVKEAGSYRVNFDASTLASGLYTYRITASGSANAPFMQSKKMMLIK